MDKHVGKTFTQAAFVIEENFFVDCVLSDCDLFYSGGDIDWMNTTFTNCRWHWRGPALKTIQLAASLGMMKAAPQSASLQPKLPNVH